MAKNKIITSQGNVQFINSKGKTINMHPMHCYAVYEDDTVSFLFIYMKEYSGQAFFASQFEDLEVNGETYDNMDDLKEAINYAFAKAGAQARTEIVTELPEDPFTNTIYLIKKEHGEGYDEWIWNEDEGWQLIGDTDIEFERYLKIDDFNPYSAATKDYIDAVSANTVQNASDIQFLSGAVDTEISAREAADSVISGAVDTLSTNLSNEVSRAISAETALGNRIDTVNGRVDAEQIARANADNALSGAIDTVDDKVEALSGEVQTMGDEAIVDAEYVSSSTTIDFYNADGTVVAQIDATDFIKDGMIEDVRIENGYLIIDFNTASGIEDIEIPLTDIFDPDNYYSKDDIDDITTSLKDADSAISGAVDNVSADLATEAQRAQNAEGALSSAIDTKLAISDFNTYSGAVETALNSKANSADVYTKSEVYTKTEVDEAIAEIDLSDYYTKTETDGLLDDKADLSALTEDERVWGAALNDLNSRINTVSGDVAGKQDALVAGENITISGNVISATGGGGKAVEGGRGISITTGETADTVSFNLPISAGTGTNSIKCGGNCTATKKNSAAFGNNASAKGQQAFAINQSTASGQDSFSQGTSYSEKYASAAFGLFNYSKNDCELSCGQYNNSVSATTTFGHSGNTLFSVGNGTANNARHNAFEIRQNGDIYLTKDGQDVKLQDQLGGGSITVDTALDSGSTNPVENRVIYNKIDEVEQVTAAGLNAVNDKFGGLKLMKITQAAYDALTVKDNNTLYIISD